MEAEKFANWPAKNKRALDKSSPRGGIRWTTDGDLLCIKLKDA